MNAGRLYDDKGQANAATACGKLLIFMRARTGHWMDGGDMDASVWAASKVRAASTRKSEINHQVNPRHEWIEHRRVRTDGQDVHRYRHVYTRGGLPVTYSDKDAALLRQRLAGSCASAKAEPPAPRETPCLSEPVPDALFSLPLDGMT